MKLIHVYLPFLLFAALIISSCSKSEPLQLDLDPQKAILGKWELIEGGGRPYNSPDYVEYLPDSIVRYYDGIQKQFISQTTYWLKDSMLYKGIYVDGAFDGERLEYHFFDNNNKLQLENHNLISVAGAPVWVYKRIK